MRLCLRLCWRWALITRLNLPAAELSRSLAGWLQGPRSRALRRAGIGRRQRVLEVGSGHGFVTEELLRRAPGHVVTADMEAASTRQEPGGLRTSPGRSCVHAITADARDLPFSDGSFDLAFFQNTLMWIDPSEDAVQEAARVLKTGGVFVALEPDYGSMIEEPNLGLRTIWLQALERAGADPLAGRKLPRLTEQAGLEPWVEFAHIPRPAEPAALDLLAELPLTALQRERVVGAREIVARADADWSIFLHVPWVIVVATR